jgi:hypothetical protein
MKKPKIGSVQTLESLLKACEKWIDGLHHVALTEKAAKKTKVVGYEWRISGQGIAGQEHFDGDKQKFSDADLFQALTKFYNFLIETKRI